MIYTIENEFLKVCVTDLGAALTKFIDKGTGIDVVIGFNTEEEYFEHRTSNIGISVGRNANRIGGARFNLNGKEYKLTVNNNANQLHGGGVNGFGYKTWKLESKSETEVVLSYFSKDGEEGFPGNLMATVSYALKGNTLTWAYSGMSDEDTVFNMTNHSYFNLGDDSILDQELYIATDKYSPTDDQALTLDEVLPVKGTGYDFTHFTKLSDNLAKVEPGIDNNYVWETMGDKLMASVRNEKLQMNVYSDLPDMHLYTSNHLKTNSGKKGVPYGKHGALCLESQFYPNGINYENYIKPILIKDKAVSHYIRYELEER